MSVWKAILVMWPRTFLQTFHSPTHGGSTRNLALTEKMVSEQIIYENGWQTRDKEWMDGRGSMGIQ